MGELTNVFNTRIYLTFSPNISGNLIAHVQQLIYFLHNGLVLNPTKTEAICFGANPRLQSLLNLTSIEVINTVPLANHVKILGNTFDIDLNFAKHISNGCSSSYFHI